jgi:hypothetical protein
VIRSASPLAQGVSFRQYIGAEKSILSFKFSGLLVVPVFQSFQLSSLSSFPVVPAFRSFHLSGCSSFPIVPAFQSFQLSGRSSYPVVPAFRLFQLSSPSSFPVVPAFRLFQLSGCSSFPVISYSSYSEKTNGISKRGNTPNILLQQSSYLFILRLQAERKNYCGT